ncbi:MAG: response regulator [Egibacteraceae bacterium]
MREGLRHLLEEAEICVAAVAGDAEALVTAIRDHRPDLAVVDVRMPPTHTDDGLRAALEIRSRWPDTAILILSQYVEERYAAELVAQGARGVGYLLKDRVAEVGEFLEAVVQVSSGGTVIDPDVVAQLVNRRHASSALERLTPREFDVLRLMAQGRSNAAIASVLVVTEGAVEKHISSVLAKLGLPPTPDDHRRVLAVLTYLEANR